MTYRLRLLLVFLLFLPGLVSAQVNEPERLRIHGSNLLGARLVPALVDRWLTDIGYRDIKHRDVGPARTEISATRDGQPLIVEIDKRGTATGISDIIDGNAEISMSARAPTAGEIDAAWQLGELTSAGQEWVIALDGLALVVPHDSPVSELSLAQLRDVLSGKISDWRELGGRAGPIAVHTLQSNSGTQELLARLLSAGSKDSAQTKRHASYQQVVTAVSNDPRGLGVVSLRAVRGNLKTLAVRDGTRVIAPDVLSVRSEDYPLVQRLYFHTGQLITALGRGFVQYAISPAGQAVVDHSEFVSLNALAMPAHTPVDAPDVYKQLVGNAKRLPITLRFSSGIDLLDSRARQDLERIAAYLRRPENAQRKLILVSFGNPRPNDPYQTLWLSNSRADFVASELLSLSLKVATARGMGGCMTLVDAKAPSASYRNDRVELWLR